VAPARAGAVGMLATLALLALPGRCEPPAAHLATACPICCGWTGWCCSCTRWSTPPRPASSGPWWAGARCCCSAALPAAPRRAPVAVVDAANCNGCRRCFVDCPYAAVTMVPHPNQRIGRLLAQVDPDLCAGCGICAGACPSSTPFRSAQQLVTGIDMPQRPSTPCASRLRQELQRHARRRPAGRLRLRPRCAAWPPWRRPTSAASACCAPAAAAFVRRIRAARRRRRRAGAACREGGCEFRLGERWTAERLAGQREPHLRGQSCRASGWNWSGPARATSPCSRPGIACVSACHAAATRRTLPLTQHGLNRSRTKRQPGH
jgi:Pyruvate/2-oxoacid:ferredoxin oxidoreductase delta subunit